MPTKAEVDAKREALARGMARGLCATEAGIAAGYHSGGSEACKLAAKPWFMKRVEELKELHLWTGGFEPAPLIMELLAIARRSADLDSGVGMNAAGRMYAEIGRLTAKTASHSAGANDDPMTEEEWLDAYGPPS